jgi:inhibitor of cysteine peptidase
MRKILFTYLPASLLLAFLAMILVTCGGDDDGGGGTVAITYSISGQATLTGSGLSNVTMALSGASSATTITDASGNYTFTGLDNGSYTITPSRTGFTFSPTSSTLTVSGADMTPVNFAATPVQAVTYSISGQATWSGSGLVNVRMDLSGTTSGSVTTDASGNYTFTGLNNGTYTVTPNKPDVTFSPASSSQTVSGANITAVNFIATPTKAGPYIIFGGVSAASSGDSTGLIGVTIALSGASSATTTTDIYGTYQFTGLSNGSHTITPSKTGFTFSPTSSTQTVNGQDITGVYFAATSIQSGQIVTCPPSGTTDVTIQNFSFTPQNVTISANGIVKWTNIGSTHTVTSGTSSIPDGTFSLGNLGTGATVCVQFPATGTYNYFCNIHPYAMIGSVVVQ